MHLTLDFGDKSSSVSKKGVIMKFYFFDYCISVLLILFHKRGSRVSLLNFDTILCKDLPKFIGSNKEILLQPQLFSIVNSTKKTKIALFSEPLSISVHFYEIFANIYSLMYSCLVE